MSDCKHSMVDRLSFHCVHCGKSLADIDKEREYKKMNEEFQADLKEMQLAVENCGIYCPFQPSSFFNVNVGVIDKALDILNYFKENIEKCRCMVDINKYIEKYEEKKNGN